MATGSLSLSDWLRAFEIRAQAFVRDERPDSLIEFDIDAEKRERLYQEVGKPCPWIVTADCPAAVTVAAVQAAADAEEGDEAYIRHFLRRIGRCEERSTWDSEYGPATERFFEKHFRHRRKSGPWRYVRTVFMHAGIVVAGIRAYAEMLDGLLARGTEFTYAEHLASVRGVSSTLIRPFLLSQTGFKFSRTTGQYLRRHRRGEMSVFDLEALRGYRHGFWPELLKHLKRDVGSRRSKVVPPPHLALDHQRCCIVLRFPPEWQARGTYRVEGHAVTYPDQRIAGRRPTRVQIGNKAAAAVAPWWGPGVSPVAVFRAGDGAFLGPASPGSEQPWTLRAGSCFIIAEQPLACELEKLQALPLGVLDVLPQDDAEPPYDIWQVELSPASAYPNLGLKTIGREALPSIAFIDTTTKRHNFGPTVFTGAPPAIRITNWTEEARLRYAIRLACAGNERELDVPAGARRYELPLQGPCQGRVWVEPRGYSSSADALAGIDFTLLPSDVSVRSVDNLLTEDKKGTVIAELPSGWTLRPLTPGTVPLDGRTWRTPAATRVFDALVMAPRFTLPISVRLPVVSFTARKGADVIWAEELKERDGVECDLEGPSYAVCDVTLRDHERSVTLVSGLRLMESGTCRVRLRAFLDSIDRAGMPLGRVELNLGVHSVSSDVWIGSLHRLQPVVSPWHDDVTLPEEFAREVPTIGPAIADLIRLKRERLHEVKVAPLVRATVELKLSEKPERLSVAVADCVSLAAALDHIVHDCPADVLPSEDAKALIAFWTGVDTVAPDALGRLTVSRWRQALDRVTDERNDEQEAGDLLVEWRATILTGAASRLSGRPGGYHLTDAARRYCQACGLPAGKLRNQALTLVLVALDEALAQTQPGTTVHTMADILRQLTLMKTGREVEADRIAALERPAVLAPAINQLKAYVHLAAIPERPGGLGLADLLPMDCTQVA